MFKGNINYTTYDGPGYLKYSAWLQRSNMEVNRVVRSIKAKPHADYRNYIENLFINDMDKLGDFIGYHVVLTEEEKIGKFYLVFNNASFYITADYNEYVALNVGATNSDTLEWIISKIDIADISSIKYGKWKYTDGSGNIIESTMPLKKSKRCSTNHVPWVNDDVDSYIKRYDDSTSSVLILLGPPGTGKTSFINHFIHQCNRETTITYDHHVMNKDQFYISFLSSSQNLLVLEDADEILRRNDGHRSEVLSKILNIGDGLLDISNKKIVITANIDSIEDIDPAIARKGRCFDILHARALTPSEANVLAAMEGIAPEFTESTTLAEIYNGRNHHKHSARQFGFSVVR